MEKNERDLRLEEDVWEERKGRKGEREERRE